MAEPDAGIDKQEVLREVSVGGSTPETPRPTRPRSSLADAVRSRPAPTPQESASGDAPQPILSGEHVSPHSSIPSVITMAVGAIWLTVGFVTQLWYAFALGVFFLIPGVFFFLVSYGRKALVQAPPREPQS